MNPKLEKLLIESRYAYKAMTATEEDSSLYHSLKKPIKENLLLDSMEDNSNFTLSGPGTYCITKERSHYGEKSIKVEGPTTLEFVPEDNRRYEYTKLIYNAKGENWNKYNRISCWVYPDCQGFQNVFISITINNDGEVKYPRDEYFEGSHHINLKNGEWNQVICEIPYVYRDCVTSISFNHYVHGSQCDMSDTATLYFSQLELQVVDEDHYEGWEINERIAFCHSGYQPNTEKVAISQNTCVDTFTIQCEKTGNVIFTGSVEEKVTDLGTYDVMDFTQLNTCGDYILCVGGRQTKPFRIHSTTWESAVWKTINFFYQERCGMEVPGIHLPCHLDCFSKHPDGRKVSVGGGWHDAGDLSQGQCNTAEAAHAFMDMAASVKDSDPQLYERLLDEARWGLQWIMRTRFGDGYRCVWTTIGLWTKNIIGDSDDIIMPALNDPFENFCGAATEAVGARMYQDIDPVFADYCLKCAKDDFKFGYDRMHLNSLTYTGRNLPPEVQLNSQGIVAAAELYKTTGDKYYLEKASFLAKIVLGCQEQEYLHWTIPIRGFFYETRGHLRPIAYEHRGHEQAPVMGLALLCELAPNHEDYTNWYKAMKLYAEYIKSIAQYNAPYGMLPSAIYLVDDPNLTNVPGEKTSKHHELKLKQYNKQVLNGIRLSDKYYLRRFPVAFKFRGFFGVLLTKAKAVSIIARLLDDVELRTIAQRQAEWVLGKNPFAQSYMYGEGYNFPNLYSEFSNDMVGELPVGIQTFENNDKPYMPMMNDATYKEVWVNTSSRFLWVLADIYGGVK